MSAEPRGTDPQLEAADILAASRLERIRMAPPPAALRPPDEATAYRLQELVHERLIAGGWGPIAGHKIGCTTAVMQAFLKIPNPCAGVVFASKVQRGEGVFPHDSFLHVGVECEIAARLGADLPLTGATYDRESVQPAVAAVMASIEVVDDRWVDYGAVDTPTLIADEFFGAGCVLGDEVTAWRDLDLEAIAGSMAIDGVEVGRGVGSDILGHPLEALAWLANLRAGQGRPLRAGEFVTLGSLVSTKWMAEGSRATIEVEGLGRASVEFR